MSSNRLYFRSLLELHKYGGGLVEMDVRDSLSAPPDSKQVVTSSKTPTNTVNVSNISVPHSDVYHMGVNSQRPLGVNQRQGQSLLQKWKGPDKISRIYGDWIDDNEWESAR